MFHRVGDGPRHLVRPVVGSSHGVVEVAAFEVDDDRWTLASVEQRRQAVRSGTTGVVGVERDDEWMRQLGEGGGDGLVAVGGAEHGDSAVAGGRGRQRVDRSLGHDDLTVACLDRSSSGEAGVGGEVRGRVEVARPVRVRVRNPDLGIDGVAAFDRWEHDASGARHPVGPGLGMRAEVRPDSVLDEHVAR